jgi:ABC-type multidrug transport system fused ATPase/permease subunit
VIAILTVTCLADWRIGAVMLLFALAAVFVVRRLQNVAVPQVKALRQAKADLSGFLEEHLGATEDIKGSGARAHVTGRLDRLLEAYTRRMKWESVAFRISSSALEIGVSIATAAVLALGAILLREGSISLGTVFAGFQYANLVSLTLFRISARMDQFNGAVAGMDRINELFAVRNEVADTGKAALPEGRLAIAFDDVRFGYKPGTPILHGLTFTVASGQTVGLLGRTGSGKSTIARLLFRGYDVSSGAIRLGGVDVRDVPLAALRSRIGVVTQEVQLLHASVRDNLTFFAPGISDSRLDEVLAEMGLGPWRAALSDGLDTLVGDGGLALSAGEGQLLAFARVLLRDPDIVILDEASSRLDPATEQMIESAVRRLLNGRTAVVIAHHLATVAQLDHIIVLEDGQILEQGLRAELADDPSSRFAGLLAGAAR